MKGWSCFPSTQLKTYIEADPAFLTHIEQSVTEEPQRLRQDTSPVGYLCYFSV